MENVLLLNSSYEPMRVISWQRAICMFFSGKVEVIEESSNEVHSVSLVIKIPAVVRLLSFVKVRQKAPTLSRANILARDQFECQYCAKQLTPKEATLDHVLPRSQGGRTSWDNLVCCCASCNKRKGNQTPKQANMPLKQKPVKPGWLPVLQIRFNGKIPDSWQYFLANWT